MTSYTPRQNHRQHYDTYPFDLSKQPPEVMYREFAKLLQIHPSTIVAVCVVSEKHLPKVMDSIMRRNNKAAQAAARNRQPYWEKHKAVLWRGCVCIRILEARTRTSPHRPRPQ